MIELEAFGQWPVMIRAAFAGRLGNPVIPCVILQDRRLSLRTKVEGWSFIDALYFAVIIMATIGYGDLSPETTFGRVFTMFYALVSVGVFVALAAKIGAILLEKEQQQARKRADRKSMRESDRSAWSNEV